MGEKQGPGNGEAWAAPDLVAPPGRSRGAVISQYYNHTIKLQRTCRPRLRVLDRSTRPSLRSYDLELDPAAREEEGEWVLVRILCPIRREVWVR